MNNEQQVEMAKLMSGPKVKHVIRVKNTASQTDHNGPSDDIQRRTGRRAGHDDLYGGRRAVRRGTDGGGRDIGIQEPTRKPAARRMPCA